MSVCIDRPLRVASANHGHGACTGIISQQRTACHLRGIAFLAASSANRGVHLRAYPLQHARTHGLNGPPFCHLVAERGLQRGKTQTTQPTAAIIGMIDRSKCAIDQTNNKNKMRNTQRAEASAMPRTKLGRQGSRRHKPRQHCFECRNNQDTRN